MLSSYTVKIVIDCYTETNGVVNIYQPSLLGPIGNFIVLTLKQVPACIYKMSKGLLIKINMLVNQ